MSHNDRLEKALKLLMDNGVIVINAHIFDEDWSLLYELKKTVSMLIPGDFTSFAHAQGRMVIVDTWIEKPITKSDPAFQYNYSTKQEISYTRIQAAELQWIRKGRPTI